MTKKIDQKGTTRVMRGAPVPSNVVPIHAKGVLPGEGPGFHVSPPEDESFLKVLKPFKLTATLDAKLQKVLDVRRMHGARALYVYSEDEAVNLIAELKHAVATGVFRTNSHEVSKALDDEPRDSEETDRPQKQRSVNRSVNRSPESVRITARKFIAKRADPFALSVVDIDAGLDDLRVHAEEHFGH